jgi:hypothetical protein
MPMPPVMCEFDNDTVVPGSATIAPSKLYSKVLLVTLT